MTLWTFHAWLPRALVLPAEGAPPVHDLATRRAHPTQVAITAAGRRWLAPPDGAVAPPTHHDGALRWSLGPQRALVAPAAAGVPHGVVLELAGDGRRVPGLQHTTRHHEVRGGHIVSHRVHWRHTVWLSALTLFDRYGDAPTATR